MTTVIATTEVKTSVQGIRAFVSDSYKDPMVAGYVVTKVGEANGFTTVICNGERYEIPSQWVGEI